MTNDELLTRYNLNQKKWIWFGVLIGVLFAVMVFAAWALIEGVRASHLVDIAFDHVGMGLDSVFPPRDGWMSKSKLDYLMLTKGNIYTVVAKGGNVEYWLDSTLKHYHFDPVHKQPLYRSAPFWVLVWPIVISVAGFICATGWGIWKDEEGARALRRGVHIEGARKITVGEYNDYYRGDGIAYAVEPRQVWKKKNVLSGLWGMKK